MLGVLRHNALCYKMCWSWSFLLSDSNEGSWLEAGSIFPSFSDNVVSLEKLNHCGLVRSVYCVQAEKSCSTYRPSCFSCPQKLKTVTPQEFRTLQIPVSLVCLCFLNDLCLCWQGFSDRLIWIWVATLSYLATWTLFWEQILLVINGNYCSSQWLSSCLNPSLEAR